MAETRLPREAAGRALVGRTYGADLRQLDNLLSFALALHRSGTINVGKTRGLDQYVVLVVFGLFAKACKTARAVRILAGTGLAEDVLVTARGLFETAVAVLFILQTKSRHRTQMFLANIVIHTDKAANVWMQTDGLKRRITKSDRAKAKTIVGGYEKALGAKLVESIRRNGYSGMKIEPTAIRIGEAKAYQVFYRLASTSAHVTDLIEHVESEKGGLILKLPPSATPNVRIALQMAYSSLWAILKRMDARLGLGHADAISRLRPKS
jgi:hypothetical protein